jgi:hypothetical protein
MFLLYCLSFLFYGTLCLAILDKPLEKGQWKQYYLKHLKAQQHLGRDLRNLPSLEELHTKARVLRKGDLRTVVAHVGEINYENEKY